MNHLPRITITVNALAFPGFLYRARRRKWSVCLVPFVFPLCFFFFLPNSRNGSSVSYLRKNSLVSQHLTNYPFPPLTGDLKPSSSSILIAYPSHLSRILKSIISSPRGTAPKKIDDMYLFKSPIQFIMLKHPLYAPPKSSLNLSVSLFIHLWHVYPAPLLSF